MIKINHNSLQIVLSVDRTEKHNTKFDPFAAVVSSENWHLRAEIDTSARVLVVLAKFAC